MRFAIVAVGVFALVVGSSFAGAAPESQPTRVWLDESTRGDLAFGDKPGGPWKVARHGDALPDDGYLRTSPAGPCRVVISEGTLNLDAETQAQLISTERNIILIAGRVVLKSAGDWSISTGSLRASVSKNAEAEFEIDGKGNTIGRTLAGTLKVAATDDKDVDVHAGQEFTWQAHDATLTIADLPEPELKRLRAKTLPPVEPQGLGQLVVNDPSGAPVRLNLARYHVNLVLHPPVALVQIDQSFYNPYPRQQEGTFVFNLPERASVSRFAMYTTPTQLIEGELIDQERAATIYQSIVSRQRDPAILEQIGGNLFRMRVFPIFPRDTKRVLLDYTVPIVEQEEGRYTFEIPLMSDLQPVWDFAITGTIRGPNVLGSARSRSHPQAQFDTSKDGAVTFILREQAFRPKSAFVLGFQQRPAEEVTVRSFVSPVRDPAPGQDAGDKQSADKRQCAFLARISPTVLEGAIGADRKPSLPVDLLILADTSGAIADRTRLRKVVRTIVKSLRAQDRFRLGCVDVDFRPLANAWIPPDSAEAGEVLAGLDREFSLGRTDFGTSFASALKSLSAAEPGRRRLVVYVGDGALPPGHAPTAELQKALGDPLAQADARFFAVLDENDPPGRVLMERLASASGGRIFLTGASGSSEELFGWVLAGFPDPAKILAVEAEGVLPDDLFVPAAWAPGRPLEILASRKEEGSLKLHIRFECDGTPQTRDWMLNLKNDPEDMFVGRLWAHRKLDTLWELAVTSRFGPDRAKFVRGIVALSQAWTLLSPYTAFLVLENESEYAKYGIVRETRHQYWRPDGSMIQEPLSPEALKALAASRRARPPTTPEQFDRALAASRDALKNRAPTRALRILDTVIDSPLAAESEEIKILRGSAEKLLARGDLLANLGPQRGWYDRQRKYGMGGTTTD
ncbi:MAG TPA: VIT and VWA domain-containing protein, partial [Planctomycetaceae bacterium]|nr:VIT and VWA domain-containing protein [Planctomycetaceae bacterium]